MPTVKDIPLTDPRVSPSMRAYIQAKGFYLKEYAGQLTVIGEEGGELFELVYALFCTIARKYYASELAAFEKEEDT